MTNRRKHESGIALAVVAVFMVALLGFAALGIDVARLAHTASEVQAVADAAARGGAKALLDSGGTPGSGIARAKVIAGLNFMNPQQPNQTAKVADVIVDEGQWVTTGTPHFACCTNNTPCCKNGSWGGTTCSGGASNCDHPGAVVAVPHTDVDNLFAGVINFFQGGRIAAAAVDSGNETSRVEKLAVASPSGPGGACQVPAACAGIAADSRWGCMCDHGVAPCLPMAVPSCGFNPPNCSGVGCSLPNSLVVSNNNSDTMAWTGFSSGANTNNVRDFLEQGTCQAPGNPSPIGPQVIGSTINLTNGINSNANNGPFGLALCLYQTNQGCKVDPVTGQIIPGQRGTVFTLPIFDNQSSTCTGQLNQSHPIVGFSTVQITDASLGSNRHVTVKVIRNTTATNTAGGGGCFGTDCRVTMVQ